MKFFSSFGTHFDILHDEVKYRVVESGITVIKSHVNRLAVSLVNKL